MTAALANGETVAAGDYYFRLVVRFETAAASHLWLNHTIAVASAIRMPSAVVSDAHKLT